MDKVWPTEVFAVGTILFLTACSGDDNFQGGLVMNVHWIHYADASGPCHHVEADSTGKDSASFASKPAHACFWHKDRDCYVYTDESAKYEIFGKLAQLCFEEREDERD